MPTPDPSGPAKRIVAAGHTFGASRDAGKPDRTMSAHPDRSRVGQCAQARCRIELCEVKQFPSFYNQNGKAYPALAALSPQRDPAGLVESDRAHTASHLRQSILRLPNEKSNDCVITTIRRIYVKPNSALDETKLPRDTLGGDFSFGFFRLQPPFLHVGAAFRLAKAKTRVLQVDQLGEHLPL